MEVKMEVKLGVKRETESRCCLIIHIKQSFNSVSFYNIKQLKKRYGVCVVNRKSGL